MQTRTQAAFFRGQLLGLGKAMIPSGDLTQEEVASLLEAARCSLEPSLVLASLEMLSGCMSVDVCRHIGSLGGMPLLLSCRGAACRWLSDGDAEEPCQGEASVAVASMQLLAGFWDRSTAADNPESRPQIPADGKAQGAARSEPEPATTATATAASGTQEFEFRLPGKLGLDFLVSERFPFNAGYLYP